MESLYTLPRFTIVPSTDWKTMENAMMVRAEMMATSFILATAPLEGCGHWK